MSEERRLQRELVWVTTILALAALAGLLVAVLVGTRSADAAGNILQNGEFNNSTASWTRSNTTRITWTSAGFANGGAIQGNTASGTNQTFTGTATQSFSISGTQISQSIIDFRWKKRSEGATPVSQDVSVRLLSSTGDAIWTWSDTSKLSGGTEGPWNRVTSANFATTMRDRGVGTYTLELKWDLKSNASSNSRPIGRFDEVSMILAFGPPHSSYAQPAYWCARCHANHSGLLPRMLRQPSEEATCYQCHDGTGSVYVIKRYFTQTYHMPVENTTGDHQTRLKDPIKTKRHVECLDCHNPHVDRGPNHYETNPGFPTNDASTKLAGVWGVSVSYGSTAWVTPDSFTVVPTVAYEYQLCLKCHSYYAYEGSPPTSPSFVALKNVTAGYDKKQTDQSREFNPNNVSYHPVIAPGRNLMTGYENNLRTVSYSGMTPDRKLKPTSTIHCTDCHRANATDSYNPRPAGPHGSVLPFILMGAWDGTIGSSHSAWGTSAAYGNHPILCFNCHDRTNYTGGGTNTGFKESGSGGQNLHIFHIVDKGLECLNCHTGVIHGSPRRRLLITKSDPAPYRTQWTEIDARDPVITGNPTGNYSFSSCNYTMGVCK